LNLKNIIYGIFAPTNFNMVNYKKFILDNGLRVLVHEDTTTPMAVLNILYDVGARDENPEQTGFAHLFEHLMFGGSVNIPSYDEALQLVGGENNAFTSNDVTNYYITLPAVNLETAFWLESDRMLDLAFSAKSLEVQKNVVCEEFKQRYLNQPYGDVWLKLRPLVYTKHPYRWATIGQKLAHIEDAKMADVKAFFAKHYNPQNAIVVVGGKVNFDEVKALCEKWFAPIPAGVKYMRNLPIEPEQTQEIKETIYADVPLNAIYMVFKMPGKTEDNYPTVDLITDILSQGKSSRLYRNLIKDKPLFSDIKAYNYGSLDTCMFVIEARPNQNLSLEDAEKAIWNELNALKTELVSEVELTKVKNKYESTSVFSEMSLLDKAMNLAYSELMGDANLINTELEKYSNVSANNIKHLANQIFTQQKATTLHYLAK